MVEKRIENIKEMVAQSKALYPDKDAVRIRTSKNNFKGITYNELYCDMNQLGTSLNELGLKDKHIAIIGENRYEGYISFLSIVNGVGVAVPLDKELSQDEIEVLINKGNVSAIIYSNFVKQKIQEISKRLPKLVLIAMDHCEDQTHYCLNNLKENGRQLISNGNDSYEKTQIDKEKFSMLFFTAGTSGNSKGVMLSHCNICTNIYSSEVGIKPIDHEDIYLSLLPVHHIFECAKVFLSSIYYGTTIYFNRGLRYISEDFKEVKPTVIMVVPLLLETYYNQIMNKIKSNSKTYLKFLVAKSISKILSNNYKRKIFKDIYDVFGGNIRKMFCGGASLNPEVAQFYRDIGIILFKGYGLTETSPLVCGDTADRFHPQSTGYLLPFIELKIADPDDNGIGEIATKGENVMLGYYNDPEATNEVLRDGWFYTGDIGYIDKKGGLYITGRKKNIIVLKNGKKVVPEELEAIINNSPMVKESLVYEKNNESKNDSDIIAQIVPDMEFFKSKDIMIENTEILHSEIGAEIERINKQLVFYKRISDFIIRENEFVKTTKKSIKRFMEVNE